MKRMAILLWFVLSLPIGISASAHSPWSFAAGEYPVLALTCDVGVDGAGCCADEAGDVEPHLRLAESTTAAFAAGPTSPTSIFAFAPACFYPIRAPPR